VNSYENLLVLNAHDRESRMIAARMELEFEALWSDGKVSLSVAEANEHYQAILNCYRQNPAIAPGEVKGLHGGCGDPIEGLAGDWLEASDAEIAFSSRPIADSRREAGSASKNRERRMILCSSGGRRRLVPVSITNLALAAIFQTQRDELLEIALYGLSPRVAEYGALLEAARRGARLRILLNRGSGQDTAARLAALSAQGLPIEIRTVGRTMHQKYIVWPDRGMVITGTANFSTDASARHWEHRLRISGNHVLAAQYSADFRTIWSRLEEAKVKKEGRG
jgi:phosphatidylserine/phosphatidylglycerophosphate/cardiolipin synthase-like enzyme